MVGRGTIFDISEVLTKNIIAITAAHFRRCVPGSALDLIFAQKPFLNFNIVSDLGRLKDFQNHKFPVPSCFAVLLLVYISPLTFPINIISILPVNISR